MGTNTVAEEVGLSAACPRRPISKRAKEDAVGGLIGVRWITDEKDLRQIKAGPISIITGRNLRRDPPKDEPPAADKADAPKADG